MLACTIYLTSRVANKRGRSLSNEQFWKLSESNYSQFCKRKSTDPELCPEFLSRILPLHIPQTAKELAEVINTSEKNILEIIKLTGSYTVLYPECEWNGQLNPWDMPTIARYKFTIKG